MKKFRNNNALFIELSMSEEFHSEINSSLAKIFFRTYPEHQRIFIAEKKHLSSCYKKIGSDVEEINYKSFPFFPRARLSTILFRDMLGAIFACYNLIRSRRGDVFFFSNILPFTQWTIFLINFILHREIFICLHGQLESFVKNSQLGLTKYYFNITLPLFRWDRITKFVLLGQPVYDAINHIFSDNTKTIIIDHPYNFSCSFKHSSRVVKLPVKVGQIGVGDFAKGTNLLFDLAKLLETQVEKNNIEFHLVGKLNPNLLKFDNGLVYYHTDPVEDLEFQELISSLDITLQLRDNSNKGSVPSGSFLDTVKYSKPFISLPNQYILHYHTLCPDSGKICDSLQEVASMLLEFIDLGKLMQFSLSSDEDLDKLKNIFSEKEIFKKFKSQNVNF